MKHKFYFHWNLMFSIINNDYPRIDFNLFEFSQRSLHPPVENEALWYRSQNTCASTQMALLSFAPLNAPSTHVMSNPNWWFLIEGFAKTMTTVWRAMVMEYDVHRLFCCCCCCCCCFHVHVWMRSSMSVCSVLCPLNAIQIFIIFEFQAFDLFSFQNKKKQQHQQKKNKVFWIEYSVAVLAWIVWTWHIALVLHLKHEY